MAIPIARFATRIFAPEIGAAAFRERLLADAFARAGYRVEVLTTVPPASAPAADDEGISVSRWPVRRDANGNIRGYLHYLSYDLPLAVRLLSRRPPDVYVAEPPPTTGLVVRLVAAVHRRPYIWYAADVWSEAAGAAGAPPWVVRVLRGVEAWVLRGAAVVLSISDGVTEKLETFGVEEQRILTVGNGVDTTVFTPTGASMDQSAPYFVYTGTMSEWQGAGVFIRALKRHHDAGGRDRIVFVGQGSELPALRQLAEELVPGAVEFTGVLSPADTAQWIRGAVAALVSIKPGLGYDFAKPTKIYAATACGVPVVFAGKGAGPALVQSQDLGWACDYDEAAVAATLNAALDASTASAEDVQLRRERLVAWTEGHASLRAIAATTCERIVAVLAQRPGRGVSTGGG
ncbi:MAG TPA: glycosyltransferase family 4 protein [Pedococcus sp.]|nr:glycosyltransferase family 4 protein [Pedococcus sp.]